MNRNCIRLTWMVALFLLLPSLTMAQTTKVRRQSSSTGATTQQSQSKASKTAQKGQTRKSSSSDMKSGIYYMCIMESWNLTNANNVCRKMAKKGYQPVLVQIPNEHDMGYFICIKTFKDKRLAEDFAKSFSDEEYTLAYIFYNGELLDYKKEKGVIEK